MYKRRQSREVTVGNVKIGGNNPISIQSMTNTKTKDVTSTVNQILALEKPLPSFFVNILDISVIDLLVSK